MNHHITSEAKTPAQRIVKYIKEKGIKQAFISEKIGMNDSTLSAKLKGRIRLTTDDIEIICWALECMPSDFLSPRPPEQIGA